MRTSCCDKALSPDARPEGSLTCKGHEALMRRMLQSQRLLLLTVPIEDKHGVPNRGNVHRCDICTRCTPKGCTQNLHTKRMLQVSSRPSRSLSLAGLDGSKPLLGMPSMTCRAFRSSCMSLRDVGVAQLPAKC